MQFNAYIFMLAFLPIVCTGFWLLPASGQYRKWWLLGASVLFYAYSSFAQLLLLLVITVIVFMAARLFVSEDTRIRKAGLLLSMSSLAVLAFFKYANFVTDSLDSFGSRLGLSGDIPAIDVLLPLGISFYTFNLISYSLDAYNRRIPIEKSLVNFGAYATFFPTIGSGPLTRYARFKEQLTDQKPLSASNIGLGAFYIVMGLAKKLIIADQIASIINPMLLNYTSLQFLDSWLVVVAYAYQLYFDFSGYTDIAMGVGYMLGFDLPINFNAPYSARNITDFWQRWHMSLSTWFREYLFFPVSRSLLKRTNRNHPDLIRSVSLLLTMTLIGLWHGASWTFVVWGAYHGFLLAFHAQTRLWHMPALPPSAARGITFGCVLLGWVLFRSTTFDMAVSIYKSMLGLNGFALRTVNVTNMGPMFIITLFALFVLTNLDRDTWKLQPENNWVFGFATAALFVTSLILIGETSPFLYLSF